MKKLEENRESSSSTVMGLWWLHFVYAYLYKYNKFIFFFLIQSAFLYCFSQQSYR